LASARFVIRVSCVLGRHWTRKRPRLTRAAKNRDHPPAKNWSKPLVEKTFSDLEEIAPAEERALLCRPERGGRQAFS
jgi:hypothetical protein